jgi:hypothetical protein
MKLNSFTQFTPVNLANKEPCGPLGLMANSHIRKQLGEDVTDEECELYRRWTFIGTAANPLPERIRDRVLSPSRHR